MIHTDTSSTGFGSVHNLPAEREREGREVEISLNSSASARVLKVRKVRIAVEGCSNKTFLHFYDSQERRNLKRAHSTSAAELKLRRRLQLETLQLVCCHMQKLQRSCLLW